MQYKYFAIVRILDDTKLWGWISQHRAYLGVSVIFYSVSRGSEIT